MSISSRNSLSAPASLAGYQTEGVIHVLLVVTYEDMLWQPSRIADPVDTVLTVREWIDMKSSSVMSGGVPMTRDNLE